MHVEVLADGPRRDLASGKRIVFVGAVAWQTLAMISAVITLSAATMSSRQCACSRASSFDHAPDDFLVAIVPDHGREGVRHPAPGRQ